MAVIVDTLNAVNLSPERLAAIGKNKIDTRRLTATIFYVSFCYLLQTGYISETRKKKKQSVN